MYFHCEFENFDILEKINKIKLINKMKNYNLKK